MLVLLLLLGTWPGLRAGRIEAGASGRGPALPTGLLRALTRAGLRPAATTWMQQAELTASDAAQGDAFGLSVALAGDGSTALVGAEGKDSSTGAAYVFVRSGTTWTQQAELTASDVAQNSYFGSSVALAGDGSTALVGADAANSDTGGAYVFVRSGIVWTQQQKLTGQGGLFGSSVALTGDGSTALVGAYIMYSSTGVAYVFVRGGTTWTQQQALYASDAAPYDEFGISVALAGDGSTALVGAWGKYAYAGVAYVFVPSGTTWTQQAELTGSDAAQHDAFGSAVALAGDGSTALVGAPGKSTSTGAAYVYAAGGASAPTSTATPTASSTPTPSATPTPQGFTYHIPVGWSMIALPGAPTTPVYASGLLVGLLFQSKGSLAALYGLTNNAWSPYLIDNHQNGTGLGGQDFILQQGVGYLLYSDRRVDFTLSPAEGQRPVPVPRGDGRPTSIQLPPLP
jgi:hypothetical protein